MTGLRLNQVTLGARDMAASVTFYQTLGLELIVDSAPRYVRFAFPEPGPEHAFGEPASLSLHAVRSDWRAPEDWPLIYFELDDIDAYLARLADLGITPIAAAKTQNYLWREADILDPSGNRIRLYQAGENRLNPPWRVEASSQ